ncbi:P44-53 outer membrane domain protein [Anaplasma phagocytophilum str. ApMUC09]|uniref:p44-53 outer membrane domain protein n=1 Tax=Anaplasma phagocytophilum str. ApMUC09 TaxID=1359152 RepID=A0A0F3N7G6_ANAPH|nr:P44-53 outer membrane domain protein [Anaplasma phagocytophilum str. ApMUC09]
MSDFVLATLKGDGSKNRQTSTDKTTTDRNRAEEKPTPNDNAEAVATDLTKLTHEEKTIVEVYSLNSKEQVSSDLGYTRFIYKLTK